jgi:hypothetical protein
MRAKDFAHKALVLPGLPRPWLIEKCTRQKEKTPPISPRLKSTLLVIPADPRRELFGSHRAHRAMNQRAQPTLAL